MSAIRPLPPHPSLEFEKKQAKTRARQHGVRLSGAQFQIAREYGFASWPKLVRYFGDVERQAYARRAPWHGPGNYPGTVQWLMNSHRKRRGWAGRALAAYVPRFYGRPLDDIYAAAITEEDARLAVARMEGFPSWDSLMQTAEAPENALASSDTFLAPRRAASKAISTLDLAELKRIVAAHPELLRDRALPPSQSLMSIALAHERQLGEPALRPVIKWLASQGLDLQTTLNERLCGHMHMKAERVRWLLDRGANPDWVAPNGIPVLEYALIRYWNGEAVDVLAARATPRYALWISAGLGDVDGVRSSLDRHGAPAKAAHRLRPPFDAIGQPGFFAPSPDPADEEILFEAFLVAMLNHRTSAMEYMASRGFDVNSRLYDTPLLNVAVGNLWVPVVESLMRCGADPDLMGYHPDMTAREIARDLLAESPEDPEQRRVMELVDR
jgi:hypothetical protein